MSREIKFKRIYRWDKDFKNTWIDAKKGEVWVGYLLINEMSLPLDRLAISPYLQYTGLKDKNGVEVYDGDLVEVGYGEHIGAIGKVIFEYGAYMLESEHKAIFQDTYRSILYGRVIGNVFENEDLT